MMKLHCLKQTKKNLIQVLEKVDIYTGQTALDHELIYHF